VNIKELVNEIKQRLPIELRDFLHYITAKTGRKCILFPDLEAEEKEHWIRVGENIYVLVNHDFEEFEVLCYDGAQEKSVKIPVPSIIYVLLAEKDVDSSKLYIAGLDVVEGE